MIDFETKPIEVMTEPKAVIKTNIQIHSYGTLPVEIIGDFTNVPKQHHEIFMMAMLAAYTPQRETKAKPSIEKDDKSFLRRLFDSITFNTKEK